MNTHPTVPMRSPFDGAVVDIDVRMQPVIAALWAHRVPTVFSCEGSPQEQAHLVFPDRGAYLAAMRVLGVHAEAIPDHTAANMAGYRPASRNWWRRRRDARALAASATVTHVEHLDQQWIAGPDGPRRPVDGASILRMTP